MKNLKFVALLLTAILPVLAKAQLVINEISQGSTAAKEYIEFVVNGTRTCTDSTADLRSWIVDDNSGWLGSGSGQGIATGCLRFANNANWAKVPYGSIILLYDDANKNPSITVTDDPTDANNDLVYVIPVSSLLIEKNTTSPSSPSSSSYIYPTTGFTPGGDWSLIGLANGGDAVITVSPANLGSASFSFGYGAINNSSAATVYNAAFGSGVVYYLSGNRFASSSAWVAGNSPTDETPGMVNTPGNAQWIAALRQTVNPITPQHQINTVSGCGSLVFNGVTYTSSTVVNDTLKSSGGCDSIYRANQINIIIPASQNVSLHGCNSLAFNGIIYNNSTTAKDTIQSVSGCDSVYIIATITIDHLIAVSNITQLQGCGSVVYNGITYTASTVLSDTVRALTGCDSIYNITNIRVVNPVTQPVILRGCGSVVFNGITYTTPTTIRDTVKSVLGCDSLYKVTRILIQNVTAVYQATSFSACRSVVYNGVTYTVTTAVKDTLRSTFGCDSVYRTTTIIIQDIAPLIQTIFLADCDSVVYNNHVYTTTMNTKDTIRSTFGCDSILINLNIRVSGHATKDSITLKGCDTVTYNGITYTDSIILRDTIKTVFGCDSIYKIANIIVKHVQPVSQSDTLLGCNKITFNGIEYTDSVIIKDTLKTAEGCDSIYRITYINIQKITAVTKDSTITSCKDIVLNGTTYTFSTTVTDTLKTVSGCDSVLQTMHIIINRITPTLHQDTLTGCNNILFHGTTYIASTAVRDTVLSGGGCDSIYNVTNIVIKANAVTQSTSVTSCFSVFYNGTNYTHSAVITDTIRTTGGCDSIYKVTNIIIQNTHTTITNDITGCGSVVFNGITYNNSIVLRDTVRTAQYCDSIYNITNITVKHIVPVSKTNAVNGCNSVVFNGVTYSSSATVLDTLKTPEGCDSVYRTNVITVRHLTPVSHTNVLYGCNSLLHNGTTFTTSTTLTDTLRSTSGCDSIYNITDIRIVSPVAKNNTVTGCHGSVIFKGITYTASTIVFDTLKSVSGCDSVYRTNNIHVENIVAVVHITNLSGCGSVVYNGVTYTSPAVLTDTLKTAAGCDSIYNKVNINIVITPVVHPITINGCGSVLFKGTIYTSSVIINDTIRTAGGCDSIYNITFINVQHITPAAVTKTFRNCSGSMVFNGITYTASAIIKDTAKTTLGCDSIFTTNIIIVENIVAVTHTASLSDCQSIIFNGVTYTSSTVVKDTLKTSGGCDSLYNITIITINAPVTNSQTYNGCDSIVLNGTIYTASITLADTTRSMSGCDSLYKIIYINVQHITPKYESNTIAGCNTLILNGTTYTANTILHDTLHSLGGCDSVFKTTNIIVQHVTPATFVNTLHGCGSLVYHGIAYTASTIVTDTTRSIGGCDSLYNTITINIVTPTTVTNTLQGCNSLVFNGVTYTNSTVIKDTVKSILGCDSLYRTNIINIQHITPVAASGQVAGCNSVVFNGATYTASQIVLDTLRTTAGCDSIFRTTHIIVQFVTPVQATNTLHGCGSLTYNGITYTASTIVTDTTRSIGGCDSLYNTTSINIVIPVNVKNTMQGCNNLVFNGLTYTASTIVLDTVKSVFGCDSLYRTNIINIQIITPVAASGQVAGCNSVVFNSVTYTASQIVLDTLRTTLGCDSIFRTTNIIVQFITPVQVSQILYGCGSMVYNGISYTASAVVTDTTRSIGGCDSLYNTTTIDITTPVTITASLKGCNSLVFNGITYTASTVVNDTLKNMRGCDSVYNVTNINIQTITAIPGTNDVKGCNSVVFNGVTYTASTIVLDTLRTTFGCDSIFRTNYISIQNITPVTNNNALSGCRSVLFNGTTYTASTIVRDTVRSSFGCDSIYNVTTVTVNNLDLSLTATPNPVIIGNMVDLKTSASVPYTVLAWWPQSLFPAQTALSQNIKADSTRLINVIGISAAGCLDTASVMLTVNYLDQLFIPNTFTPNNDGRNDEFRVYGNNINKVVMKIFNQWGQMIFECSEQLKGWNGTYKGQLQPIGVYVYVVQITMKDNSVINRKGSINLVR